MLNTEIKAPNFWTSDRTETIRGRRIQREGGNPVFLQDNTPGCANRPADFSERYPQFMEKGTVVLSVSGDTVACHKRFEERYGLVFTLLSDPEHQGHWGLWCVEGKRRNYGKGFHGRRHLTYLIDEKWNFIRANDNKVKAQKIQKRCWWAGNEDHTVTG